MASKLNPEFSRDPVGWIVYETEIAVQQYRWTAGEESAWLRLTEAEQRTIIREALPDLGPENYPARAVGRVREVLAATA